MQRVYWMMPALAAEYVGMAGQATKPLIDKN